MNYDFDMHSVLPLAAQRKARSEGLGGDLSGQQIALFRDPKVADALRAADRPVQELFLESGFGLTSWSCDLPRGRFRASDEAARNQAISRFAANLRASRGALRNCDWGGFSISDFTDGYLSADPLPQPRGILARGTPEDPLPLEEDMAPVEALMRRGRARQHRRRRLRHVPRQAAAQLGSLTPLQRICAIGLAVVSWLLALSIVHLVDHGLGTEVAHAMTRLTGF